MPVNENDPLNPKDAIADTKLPLHLWPASATALGSLGIYEGMLKYGRTNWRAVPVKASVYVSALKRHINAYEEGENADPSTNGDHLGYVLACAAILIDARTTGTLVDDRNYNGKGYLWLVESLAPQIANLQQQFKDRKPQHYTIENTNIVRTAEKVARHIDNTGQGIDSFSKALEMELAVKRMVDEAFKEGREQGMIEAELKKGKRKLPAKVKSKAKRPRTKYRSATKK